MVLSLRGHIASNIPHPTTNAAIISQQAREILAGRRHAFQHVGLATCRPDGFVSLDAGSSGGELRTRPFRWQGRRLLLNVDASGGEVTATLLDESGSRPAVLGRSAPITGDHVEAAAAFEDLDPATLQGRRVSLRLRMTRAKLYSYRLAD